MAIKKRGRNEEISSIDEQDVLSRVLEASPRYR
jgi:hypothetical protein